MWGWWRATGRVDSGTRLEPAQGRRRGDSSRARRRHSAPRRVLGRCVACIRSQVALQHARPRRLGWLGVVSPRLPSCRSVVALDGSHARYRRSANDNGCRPALGASSVRRCASASSAVSSLGTPTGCNALEQHHVLAEGVGGAAATVAGPVAGDRGSVGPVDDQLPEGSKNGPKFRVPESVPTGGVIKYPRKCTSRGVPGDPPSVRGPRGGPGGPRGARDPQNAPNCQFSTSPGAFGAPLRIIGHTGGYFGGFRGPPGPPRDPPGAPPGAPGPRVGPLGPPEMYIFEGI